MTTYIIRRAIQALIVLQLVTLVVFLLMRMLPGDPILVYVSQDSWSRANTPEEVDAIRRQFGTDRPLYVQYVDWFSGVLRGDLGDSIFSGSTVNEEIRRALPKTVYVGSIAWIIAHLIGVPAGIICAIRQGKWQDNVLTVLANAGVTAPIFWVGILLIYGFAMQLDWLPIQGYTSPFEDLELSLRKLIMPVFCLALPHMSGATRQTRSAILEVAREDFVRTAWAKGLSERSVVLRHVIRNGIMPVVTLGGLAIPRILGGQVLIETIFNIPGMGRLAVGALFAQDYAIVQGVILVIAAIVVVTNLLVDLSYGWIDPRIQVA